MTDAPQAQPQPGLVTRFHLLVLLFTVAMGVAGVVRATPGEVLPLHWGSAAPDLAVPPAIGFAAMPLVAGAAMLGAWALSGAVDPYRREAVRHIVEPALSAFLIVAGLVQLGLMMLAAGSEFDLIRIAGFALSVPLLLLGILFPEAQRQSYAGLRLPWRIASDTVWKRAHRAAGVAFVVAAIGLALTAWLWPAPVTLVPAMFAAMLLPVLIAWGFSTGRGAAS